MSDGNGQQPSGSERLDRMERILELILNDHVLFREEHKFLLTAQVQMQGGLENLRSGLDTLRGGLDTLRGEVNMLVSQLRQFGDNVEAMHQDFRQFGANVEAMRQDTDARLKRLGG